MNPIQSLYYVSPACAACLALPFIAVELPEIMANTTLVINYPMLLMNAITAFALNLAVFLLIGGASCLHKYLHKCLHTCLHKCLHKSNPAAFCPRGFESPRVHIAWKAPGFNP
jgi:hypothetical protein